MDSTTTGAPVLRLRGIRKTFGPKVAIDSMDLEVAAGEVHALCGENGAGKSTLMNILVGIHQPDSGEITVRGRQEHIDGPAGASRLGIGMVHQHFTLVPSMTVAENIYLGRQPRRWGLLADRRAMHKAAGELLERYGFPLDPGQKVSELTVGQRQRVEIVKALAFDAEILILDEPTAVLTPAEVDELMDVIAKLRERGRTVLFITHKLREVKAVADRVTVIRHGLSVGTRDTDGLAESEIAGLMVGRSVFMADRRQTTAGAFDAAPALLELDGVSCENTEGRRILDEVALTIRPGEVLGIAGVEGNGQTELAEAVTGLRRVTSGRILLDGRDVTSATPRERREAGTAFIPEDRLDRGLSPEMSVAENLGASNYRRAGLIRRGMVSQSALREFTSGRITEFDIRGAQPDTPVGTLSGGNMQKVVVARELAREPSLLVVAQPTRGVDIGASEFVHRQILAAAARGTAVLLISSELSEVLALSDRIGVMLQGRLVEVIDTAEATETRLGLAMSGATGDDDGGPRTDDPDGTASHLGAGTERKAAS
ncbi:ABC transporter ATP-binding protein [Streptomyces sp. NBC_01320]|uniref:ABC transporter ATP-binding protein n=1 Tax=Streptomyces sp. NBC_01320 TaxID=2903824 RepID=UPI002E12ECFF|nr:ABC transporter ATP-binding protein [Streptomyces sp. NBC_01320]